MRTPAFSSASITLALLLACASSGCTGTSETGTAPMAANALPAASGLQITDVKVGTGISPKPGQICVVHYTGWIYENGAKGKKFDSSVDRKTPFSFVMGDHKVIEGWERGVSTMRVGGKRILIIPPSLGYGATGAGASIPPNATLMFEVELLDVKAAS